MLTSNGYVLDESPHRLGPLEAVPAEERDRRDDLLRRLDRDGYLWLRGHLEPSVVVRFREYYFRSLAGIGLVEAAREEEGIAAVGMEVDQGELRRRLFRDIVPGAEFAQLCQDPSIKAWFSWLLDGEVHLHKRKIIRHVTPRDPAGPTSHGIGTATQAHYDLLYLRGGSDRVLSMWIPLGPCLRDMGGLIYLEGSHRRIENEEKAGSRRRGAASITADLPSLADEHDARWLYADYAPGDVVVHSPYLIHAATDNVDPRGRLRLSTDIRYQLATEQIDERWQQHWFDTDGL